MAILTDQEFIDAVQKTPKIIPRSLWQHLNEIAQYLALVGETALALKVWKIAHEDFSYVPEVSNDYGDASVTALCAYVDEDDFSRCIPASKVVRFGDSVQERVLSYDQFARRMVTVDMWHPLASNEAIELMRSACRLARPPKGQRFSPTEADALPELERFLAHPLASHQPTAQLNAALLGADIALRHQQETRARDFLDQ